MSTEHEERAAMIAANKDHYDAIDFGMEVRTFIGSKIGVYLVDRAEAEREQAMADLVDISAFDSSEIMRLQSSIKRAESIQRWMAELIQEGVSAAEQLLNQDQINTGGEQ